MLILGIETSCDETAAALVEDGRLVHSNIVASQIPVHQRFGGVVPEIASRQHVLAIDEVVNRALEAAGIVMGAVDAVAATFGPGLSGPLLVGTTFAKGISMASGRSLVAVDHIEGHLLSVWLSEAAPVPDPPELPMVSLVASGGHTELVLIRAPGSYAVLGRTIDDAAGEAFDKVGRLLGLPYPGGPEIERMAAAANGNRVNLPRAWLPGTFDFSFSGLKTAVSREVSHRSGPMEPPRAVTSAKLAEPDVAAISAAFQDSVADVLSAKLAAAVRESNARSAAIVGGVANNMFIREAAAARLQVPLHVPGPGLSSDNAAMIAGAAFWNQRTVSLDYDVDPNMHL